MIKFNSFVAAATLSTALTAVASLGISSHAQAQSLTLQGTSSGTFGTPNRGANTNSQSSGVGTNTFTFGGGTPNRFTFSGNSFSTGIDSPFAVGNFTYLNEDTQSGTDVASVPLNIQLGFTNPSGVNQILGFDLGINTTPNNTGDPVLDADSVFPVNRFANSSFNVGGTDYTLELIGFSQDGGATVIDQFILPEGQTTASAAIARITAASNVPEPSSTVGLLALGVLGSGAMLKRKLKNQKLVKLDLNLSSTNS